MNDMTEMSNFLQARRSGIGGSDVAGILGLSPWKSPLDIYLSKVEEPKPWEMSEPAYWGHVLEDVVAQEFAKRKGVKIQRINKLIRHPNHQWAIANIDRAIVVPGSRARLSDEGILLGAEGLLECKTAGQYSSKDWGREDDDEAIPVWYAAQAMWYLGVTGLPYCDFATLIGGQKFVTKRIERDEDTIKSLIEQCEAFWFNHVMKGVPPEPRTAQDAAKLFGQDNGESVEADEVTLTAYNDAVALRETIKASEEQLEEKTTIIKLALKEASNLTIGGKPVITYKKAKDGQKTNWKEAADGIKGWMIANNIEGGVDAVREVIDANTERTVGSRRFLFK